MIIIYRRFHVISFAITHCKDYLDELFYDCSSQKIWNRQRNNTTQLCIKISGTCKECKILQNYACQYNAISFSTNTISAKSPLFIAVNRCQRKARKRDKEISDNLLCVEEMRRQKATLLNEKWMTQPRGCAMVHKIKPVE